MEHGSFHVTLLFEGAPRVPARSTGDRDGAQTKTLRRVARRVKRGGACWRTGSRESRYAVATGGDPMLERRAFGRTGHQSSVTLFGGAALAQASQADADCTLELLLRHGVNHIDTAARYGDSELRIGPWMARHRKDFFLATKTGSRTAGEAREDIRRSLDRLRVDHVDLIQLHSLAHPDDWDQAMGPGGALEAAVEARAQGLARFIGVTGHGWTIAAMHRRSLARFDFDAVLLPFNFFMAQNERYRRTFEEVLAICRERNVAVQVIKSIARGPWATADRTHATWYQPLEAQADIDRAVHWILGLPGVFLNTAGDLALLPKILDGASRFERRPADAEMSAMLGATRMTSLFGLAT
jgi:aryl-alcohol dehydrogenase-like predicted oxidoreductase